MRRLLILLCMIPLALAFAEPAFAEHSGTVQFLNSGKVMPATLPFSEAVRVGNMLYLSGQVGIVPGTMKLVPGSLALGPRVEIECIATAQ